MNIYKVKLLIGIVLVTFIDINHVLCGIDNDDNVVELTNSEGVIKSSLTISNNNTTLKWVIRALNDHTISLL